MGLRPMIYPKPLSILGHRISGRLRSDGHVWMSMVASWRRSRYLHHIWLKLGQTPTRSRQLYQRSHHIGKDLSRFGGDLTRLIKISPNLVEI